MPRVRLSSRGEVIEFDSPHSREGAMALLDAMIEDGRQSSPFAQSLSRQHTDRGSLSDVQWGWVRYLVHQVEQRESIESASSASDLSTTPTTSLWTQVCEDLPGNRSPLATLFVNALSPPGSGSVALQRPRLRMRVDRGDGSGDHIHFEVRLNRNATSGSADRRVGAGFEVWVGSRVLARLGEYRSLEIHRHCPAFLADFLRGFAQMERAPMEAVIAEMGRSSSNCCYCGRALSDERSVAAGYGSTCARRWNLPWGGQRRHPLSEDAPAPSVLDESPPEEVVPVTRRRERHGRNEGRRTRGNATNELCACCSDPIVTDEASLELDPLVDPDGYRVCPDCVHEHEGIPDPLGA